MVGTLENRKNTYDGNIRTQHSQYAPEIAVQVSRRLPAPIFHGAAFMDLAHPEDYFSHSLAEEHPENLLPLMPKCSLSLRVCGDPLFCLP
jgi:hypothetical protein